MPIPKHSLSSDGDAPSLPSAAHETWFRNLSCGGGIVPGNETLSGCGRIPGFNDGHVLGEAVRIETARRLDTDVFAKSARLRRRST